MTIAPAVGADGVGVERRLARARALRQGPLDSPAVAALLAVLVCLATGLPVAAADAIPRGGLAQPATVTPTPAVGSLGAQATYEVTAKIGWSKRSLLVTSRATVTNTAEKPLGHLTFNLVPLVTGIATLLSVKVDGATAEPHPIGQTVNVPLPAPLGAGERTTVTIRYRAHFNAIDGSRQELLGRADGIITAYRWIPWLSRRQPLAAPGFGETWVTGVSPSVTVTLTSGKPLVYATSGRRTSVHGRSQTFKAHDVRDFNFSASPNYKVSRTTWNGVAVRVFHVNQSADELAQYAVAALDRYNDRVGPYAYPRLNVAEAPVATGMESPALVWISSSAKPGSLQALVSHEVAHQWFYAAVGNDQAHEPFLDEAMATFLASNLLGSFHHSACAPRRLDLSVYDYSARCYVDIVYTQGARYLENYRADVGGRAFWRGLRQFYDDEFMQVASTRSLLDHLDAASGFDSAQHAARFPSLYP